MRVISINLNGIRSAAKKGFFDWIAKQNADFICVQETKSQMCLQPEEIFRPANYHCYFHDAEKKGYSGTGVYSLLPPEKVHYGLGFDTADKEGRYVQLDFKKFSIASLYIPSGTMGDVRQKVKYAFMDEYLTKLKKIAATNHDMIICGDWNIAHKEIDLKHWRENQNHTGFLPDERVWLDQVFGKVGLVDAFRVLNQEPNQYTWWSNFGHAWDNNAGWRIDYQVVTPGLKNKIKAVKIYKEQRFSDHAPLIVDYEYTIS